MRNKKIEDLIHMPEIEDPVERKIAELLSRLCSVTLTNYPDLFSLIILKTGNYGIQHGNTEMSCVGYVGYGITAGSILGDYKAGNKFGKISIKLAEKYKYSPSLCIVYFVVGALVSHWSEHASNGLEYLYKAVNYGMEAGDLLMIGYAHCFILEIQYFLGLPLDEMAEVVKGKHELARKLKHGSLGINAAIYERVVSALRGSTEDTKGAKGISLFEQQDGEFMQMMNEDQTSLATYYFHRMYFYYMEGNYRDALSVAKEIESLIGSIIGLMISAEYIFYYSLIIVSIYDE